MARRLVTAVLFVAGALLVVKAARADDQRAHAGEPLAVPARDHAASAPSFAAFDAASRSLASVAASRNVELSESARDQALREAFRSRAASVSQTGVVHWDPAWFDATVAEMAKKSVSPTPGDVSAAAAGLRKAAALQSTTEAVDRLETDARVRIAPDAKKLLQADVKRWTDEAAKAGVPADEISQANTSFVRQALGVTGTRQQLDTQIYASFKDALFKTYVRVNIQTVPAGASVEMEGRGIGKTALKKPLEPNQTYTFSFRLAGYKPAVRPFFVQPGSDELNLVEVLIPEPPAR